MSYPNDCLKTLPREHGKARQIAETVLSILTWPITQLLLLFILGYRYLVSPALSPRCRFTPTCSEYAEQSLRKDGLFKGLFKTMWRLLRCHPFCKGGYDPP